jgi:hypothetical protein
MNHEEFMKNLFLVLLASLSLSLAAWADGPTSSGGGGNICFTQSGPELLDMVVNEQIYPHPHFPGIQIQKTGEKFTVFNPLKTSLKDRIDALTQPFMKRFPETAKRLEMALQNSWYFAVPNEFQAAIGASYQSLNTCNPQNTRAAIGLEAGVKFVSIPTWNSLDLDTQAYLVIHEAWRFMQIVLGEPITNLELQRVTYDTITNHQPRYAAMETASKHYCERKVHMLAPPESRVLDEQARRAWTVGCATPSAFHPGYLLDSIASLMKLRLQSKDKQVWEYLSTQIDDLNAELNSQDQKDLLESANGLVLNMIDIPMAMVNTQLQEFPREHRRDLEQALADLMNKLPQR